MEVVDTLQKVALFADIERETLEKLAAHLEVRKFSAGETLCREGDPASTIFVVHKGRVKVSKGAAAQDVVELGPGAHVGEIGMLLESDSTATVTALEETEVLGFSIDALDQALVDSPYPAAMFFRALAISLADRLRHTTDDVTLLKQKLR